MVGSGWHSLELHLGLNGAASTVEVWLDGVRIAGLSNASTAVTAAAIGQVQIGDTATGAWDVVLDDAAFGTNRLGPNTDTVAPTVTASVSGTSGTITFSANASDNVGVTKVEFWLDGVLRDIVTSAPYTLAVPSTQLTNGSHSLVAKAYDAAGTEGVCWRNKTMVLNKEDLENFIEEYDGGAFFGVEKLAAKLKALVGSDEKTVFVY